MNPTGTSPLALPGITSDKNVHLYDSRGRNLKWNAGNFHLASFPDFICLQPPIFLFSLSHFHLFLSLSYWEFLWICPSGCRSAHLSAIYCNWKNHWNRKKREQNYPPTPPPSLPPSFNSAVLCAAAAISSRREDKPRPESQGSLHPPPPPLPPPHSPCRQHGRSVSMTTGELRAKERHPKMTHRI